MNECFQGCLYSANLLGACFICTHMQLINCCCCNTPVKYIRMYGIYPCQLFEICVIFLCTWQLFQNEPDCPGYPTERFTVDVDGVQVADLTADEFQSLAINHANGSVTLFLPLLSQPLPEDVVTLNMTKYNTVPTNRSDVVGKIATEMVPWGTSAVFGELEWPLCTRVMVFTEFIDDIRTYVYIVHIKYVC